MAVDQQTGFDHELRVAHRLTAALHQAESPTAFYNEAVEAVVTTLGVDRASLQLYDDDGVMRFMAWRGLSAAYRRAAEGHTPWSPDDTDAVPILVADVAADEALREFLPLFREEGIQALAVVPLIHRGRLVGKFMLYHGVPHEFSPSEVSIAEILAAHVALALERRLTEAGLRRQQDHLQLALAAGEMGAWDWDIAAGTVNWSPTLEAIHGLPVGAFAGTVAAFLVAVHPDDRSQLLASIGAAVRAPAGNGYAVTYRIIRPDGEVRWVSASGRVLRDLADQPVQLVGVCADVTGRRHTEHERELLLAAERTARVDAEASAARLASLQHVTAELSRAVSAADVAEVVVGMAITELGATTGALCLVDGDVLEIVHAVGYDDDVMKLWTRFPIDVDLPASDAVRTGQAVFLRSSRDRSERYPIFDEDPVVGVEAFAMIPVSTGDEPIGCLVLGFPNPRDFSTQDETFLGALAAQSAAALDRARLYEEREQARRAAEGARARAVFLAETSALLATSLDYEKTLVRVAEVAVPQLADGCAIFRIDQGRITPVAVTHRDPQRSAALRDLVERFPLRFGDRGGVGAVARQGVATVSADMTADMLRTAATNTEHLELLHKAGLGPAMILPLVARRRTVGVIALTNEVGRPIDDADFELAQELASRAGTAIDNALLFHEKTRISRTLQASLLPPSLPRISGVEIGAVYHSGAAGVEVGGDFYDVFSCDARRHLMVLGDVCGRGVEAATLAALTRHTIRSAALNNPRPSAILSHTNEVLLREQTDDYEPRFCTALIAAFEPYGGEVLVTLSIAGHPSPLLRRADGHVEWVGAPGSLLGVDPAAQTTEVELRLRPGDALVAFTDGATERRRDSMFFGEDGMIETLRAASGDAQTLADTIGHTVLSFAPDDPGDDLAVLVLRVTP